MFIRKWRYLQNLENARSEGIRERKREASEQKFAYILHLEEENKALKEKLVSAKEGVEILRQELDEKSFPKKMLIETLANELACYQKTADVAWYVRHDQNERSRLLNNACVIKELANLMAIGGDVYERAYQIYDFRNSGKDGYTLKEGKIVKVEQEEELPQTPFAEGQETMTAVVCDVSCGEENVAQTADNPFCDEESFF